MKALTLTQPWATLVARGRKRVETRSWTTQYRGLIAIHAAKALPQSFRGLDEQFNAAGCVRDPSGYYSGRELPRGVVLAVGRLADVRRIDQPGQAFLWGLSDTEVSYGDFSVGRYAWFLRDIAPLDEPVPARGALSLWEWHVA